jgi:WD40 repeat protein
MAERTRSRHAFVACQLLSIALSCLVAGALHAAEGGAIRTGSIGAGRLRDLFILPDGQVLRVLQHHVELTDLGMVNVTARFAHHAYGMGRVTLSADGASFAVVNSRTGVERWDIASRARTSRWILSERLGSRARLSPDLSRMAVYDGNAIVLLDSADGTELGRLDWPSESGRAQFAFSHDNAQLFASRVRNLAADGDPGVFERVAELWDLDSLQLTHTLEALRTALSPNPHWSPVFSRDERWLFAAAGPVIRQWDVATGERQRLWHARDRQSDLVMGPKDTAVYAVVIRPEQSYAWAAIHSIMSWDAITGDQTAAPGHKSVHMRGFSLSADEQLALVRHRGGSAGLWDLASGTRLGFDSRYVTPTWGTLADEGRYFVAVDPGYTSWEIPSGEIRDLEFPVDAPHVGVVPGPGPLVAVDAFQWVEIRDVRTAEVVRRAQVIVDHSPIRFTSDGASFAVVGRDEIIIRDLADRAPDVTVELSDLSIRGHDIERMAFSQDDRYLAVASDWGWLHVWARANGGYALHHSRQHQADDIYGIEFTRDAAAPVLLVAARPDITAWRIDAQESTLLWTVPGSTPMALVDAGGTPGKFLLTNGDAGMGIIDVQRGVVVADGVTPKLIAANSDGSVVVTSEDYDTAVWDIRPVLDRHAVSVDARDRQLGKWGAIKRTTLLPNYPNPFNPETWIPFTLASSAAVRVDIYDAAGRHVRHLDLGALPAGDYLSADRAAHWNGANEAGEPVASGAYTYRFRAGEYSSVGRMVVAK